MFKNSFSSISNLNIIKTFTQMKMFKSKNIFLLDAFGALLTAIILYFILRNFNTYFGLSKDIFEYLSIIAPRSAKSPDFAETQILKHFQKIPQHISLIFN